MICRVKSIALAVALCSAGIMVAQGRDFGLVSIPDALDPQPRPEDVYECTISGKTWFGCAYERRGDENLVIYEGAVVVEGAYFVVWFALPPTQPLDREVMDILAQIRLQPGRETKVRKMLSPFASTVWNGRSSWPTARC